MYDLALVQYAWQLQMAQQMLADIDDADLARQLIPGGNHAAWIVGHLTLVSDMALKMMGQPMLTPEPLHPLFAPGSQLHTDRAVYPTKSELLERFAAVHAAFAAALPRVPADVLAQPNPIKLEALRSLPTVAHLFMHLLTTHEAFHIGQLSAWRRALGRKPLF